MAKSKKLPICSCPQSKKPTLNAVISGYVEEESFTVMDMWGGYNDLSALGYHHEKVNNSENYVDPKMGARTQEIESACNIVKASFKRIRGVRNHLQSLVDEVVWRMLRYDEDKEGRLFAAFIADIKVVHGQVTCSNR